MRKNCSHRQSRKKFNPSETRPNLLVTETDMTLKSDKHAETLCKKLQKKTFLLSSIGFATLFHDANAIK